MPVPFLDAKPGQCRFPLWPAAESIGDVCGRAVRPGKSYCPECHDRTRVPGTARAPFVPRQSAPRRPVAEDVTPDLVELVA